MSGFSFSIPPFFGHIPETVDQIRLPGIFPVAVKADWRTVSKAKPIALAQADKISPERFPYELAGVEALGKRLSLHAALPPNVFAQHAMLNAAKLSGLLLSGSAALLTAAYEYVALLSPIDLQMAANGMIFGAYFMGAGIATMIFAQAGLIETANSWRQERDFRSWREATRVLPEKLHAAKTAIRGGIPNFNASLKAIEAFEELIPYLDRSAFFQAIDFRNAPSGPMRRADASFLREAGNIGHRGHPLPSHLPGESMIDDVGTAWAWFGSFASARLINVARRFPTARGTTRFALREELGRYAKLAALYERHARRPAPWNPALASIIDSLPE